MGAVDVVGPGTALARTRSAAIVAHEVEAPALRPSMMVVNVVVEAPQPTAAAPVSVPAPAPVPRETYLPPPELERPSIVPPPMAAARYAAEARAVDPVQPRAGLIVDVRA